MYRLFIKIILVSLLLLLGMSVYSQNSGTFKVTKKEPEKNSLDTINLSDFSDNNFNSDYLMIGLSSTLARESSPKTIRSYNLTVGLLIPVIFWNAFRNSGIITVGFSGGKANPTIGYDGNTLGGFIAYYHLVQLGSMTLSFPLEVEFKRLFNKLDYPNLDQRSLSMGIGTSFHSLPRIYFTALGTYHIDKNTVDKFKGLYPTFRIDFRF